jgi:hypothetical protein
MLERKRKELPDAAGYTLLLPQVVLTDWQWIPATIGIWARCDPDLRAWSDLLGAADVDHFATRFSSETASPRMRVQPNICLSQPNMRVISELGVPVFHPREGHEFLVVRLSDLRLRCLAVLCRQWYGPATAGLYPIVRISGNPIHALADRLCQSERHGRHFGVDEMNHEFEALQQNQPEEYGHWISLAQSLLDVLPLGLPYEIYRGILEWEYGLDHLPLAKWKATSKTIQ